MDLYAATFLTKKGCFPTKKMRKRNKIDGLRDSIRRNSQEAASQDDMYSRFKRETRDTKDGDTSSEQTEKEYEELDVPGAELDDQQEEIGSEDEENNYYSVGGEGV